MLKKLIVIENGQDYQFDSKEELVKAVEAYNKRDRRYGGIKEEK